MHVSSRAACFALCAILATAGGLAGQETVGPRAAVDQPIADLGVITRGETATYDFAIRNEGDEVLEITDVRPACGCTVADYPKTIAPGESGILHAEVDTTDLKGATAKGISVYTNDPENPRLQLTLRIRVQEYLIFNPGFARFVQAQGAGVGAVDEIFFSSDFDDLQIEKVESPYPFLEVSYREATPEERWEGGAGRQWFFELALDYDHAPVGPIAGEVVVHTNHPKQASTRLPVSGFVRPMLAVTPPVADLKAVEVGDEPQTARLLVKSFAPFPVHVTGVETDVPGIEAAVTTATDGKVYIVELTLSPEMPKGEFSGKVTIHTDAEREPVVLVDLKGTIL